MRYYSTKRPVTPGSFPKPEGNKVLEIVNFDEPTYCREADRDCWGYIEYEKPLTERQAVEYELVRERLLDFNQRYMAGSGTSILRTFATAAELNEWWEAQGSERRYFCRLYDCEKRIDISGSDYMWLKPEERWQDDPQANLFDGAGEGSAEQGPAPKEAVWYPVTVSSRKHGGGLRVNSGRIVRAAQRPEDAKGDTAKMQRKTRYFGSWREAQRVINVIQNLDITTERVRMSATQGEVKVYINGKYILNFGDKIVLPERGASPEDYYGDDIGGWRSSEPDSSFVLGLIWHPFDHAYHYSDLICRKLSIKPEEWIGG